MIRSPFKPNKKEASVKKSCEVCGIAKVTAANNGCARCKRKICFACRSNHLKMPLCVECEMLRRAK